MTPPQKIARLEWVDNLRTFMILLVVNMHACVTYSHVGDWYYMAKPEPGMSAKAPFIFWQGHLQSFFMGLLFFLAGYFALGSLRKRGPGGFMRERFQRLGIPAFLYMVIIHPCTVYFLLGLNWKSRPRFSDYYSKYILGGNVLSGSGPLWFALALLVFCVVLAAIHSKVVKCGQPPAEPPSTRSLVLGAVGLILSTFLIRLVQPIGTNILNLQLCFFPQYIFAFASGVAAARGGWLQTLAGSTPARRAWWIGILGGPVALGAVLALGASPGSEGLSVFQGGWHWQAFGLAAWEQATGLCLGLGIMAVFQKRFSLTAPWLQWLSDRSFAVYVLHPPVLIALAMGMNDLHLTPIIGAVVLTAGGLVGTFLIGDLARRVPFLRHCL